jgi:hypothetical protein
MRLLLLSMEVLTLQYSFSLLHHRHSQTEFPTHQGNLQAMSNLFSVQALFKSANRLRDSLLPKDEPKPAIPLLLLIAQHRSV